MTDWEKDFTSITEYGEIDDRGLLRVDEFAVTPKFRYLLTEFTVKANAHGYAVNHMIDNSRNFDLCIWLTKP